MIEQFHSVVDGVSGIMKYENTLSTCGRYPVTRFFVLPGKCFDVPQNPLCSKPWEVGPMSIELLWEFFLDFAWEKDWRYWL